MIEVGLVHQRVRCLPPRAWCIIFLTKVSIPLPLIHPLLPSPLLPSPLRPKIPVRRLESNIKAALLLNKILGHIGELLEEYRALGMLLETGGEGAIETERQRLLLQRFETARQSFLRSYRNAAKEQPYETAAYYIRQVLYSASEAV